MKRFYERRAGRERRDWNEFVTDNHRTGAERRSGADRRQNGRSYSGPERRRVVVETPTPPPQRASIRPSNEKAYYSTAEVAELTGLSQSTLLLWIRNKMIDGSRIKRSVEGKRLWTPEDVDEIRRVKTRNGWTA